MEVNIVMEGMKSISHVQTITLDCSDYNAENTMAEPKVVVPEDSSVIADGNVIMAAIHAKNFVIFKARK